MSRAPMPDSVSGDAPMPSSFDQDLEFWEESRWAKFTRKLRQEPLVPVGLALTCYALYGATRSIRRGDKESTNRYFRARVYAQAFTLVCVCVGAIYWKGDREQRKMYQGLLGEKRARERKEAWIKELEARDREDEIERVRRRERRKEREGMAEKLRIGKAELEMELQDEGVVNPSLVDEDCVGMRRMLVGEGVLAQAMAAWWSRRF